MPDWLRSVFTWTRLGAGIGIAALFGLGAVSGNDDAAVPVLNVPLPGVLSTGESGPGATVATPATPEKTVAETAPEWVSKLALRYQPIVAVARADRFWPVPVSSVLGLQAGERKTCLWSSRSCPPAAAPTLAQLTGDAGEGDYLVYPGLRDRAANQAEGIMQLLGINTTPKKWITDPGSSPYQSAQQYFFLGTRLPDSRRRVLPDRLSLQYWSFYPFNYLPIDFDIVGLPIDPETATRRNWNYHEGDWEHVSVLLRPVRRHTGDVFKPEYVYMARHDKEGELLDWDKVERRGQHPVVYASLGGHTSYEHCGIHRRSVLWKWLRPIVGRFLYDVAVCDENGHVPKKAPAGPVFEFGPTTRLVELQAGSWACWRGRFGSLGKKIFGIPRSMSRLSDGPKAPLRQFENKEVCESASR
jgi:hypothetical protein